MRVMSQVFALAALAGVVMDADVPLSAIRLDTRLPAVRDHLVRMGCPTWARHVPAAARCWGQRARMVDLAQGRSPFGDAPPIYSTNTASWALPGPRRGPPGSARLHACGNRATRLRMTTSIQQLCQLYSLTAADVAVLLKIDPRTAARWAFGSGEPAGLHRAFVEALVELHSAEMERAVKRAVQLGGPMTLFLAIGTGGGKAPRRSVEALAKAAGVSR